jgi:protoporphyrinogen oxidase
MLSVWQRRKTSHLPKFWSGMTANISVICIGAGPAGLTAACYLSAAGKDLIVIEKDPTYVGGISKTVRYRGFYFDIGGHRFFSKSTEVENFWTEILGPDMLNRPRKSRILYRGKFFDYPLKGRETVLKLGLIEAAACVLSYTKQIIFPIREPKNFEEWVTNQFGARLFRIFFKTYTEKVWGMSCKEISADWAAQRIRGLSLGSAIRNAILPRMLRPQRRHSTIKTLVTQFRYPRKGPGMLWEAVAERVKASGGQVIMDVNVCEVALNPDTRRWTVVAADSCGRRFNFEADHVISSMPIKELITALKPAPAVDVCRAAASLRYRDFLMVALIVKERDRFDDNWIYIHDPSVRVGRIQNFASWSPEMVPNPDLNCYGMEYFCNEGDEMWSLCDTDLIALANKELCALSLSTPEDIVDGHVVRQLKAYPVYDEGYQERVDLVRTAIAAGYPTLHLVGRNGMHKYNNQDHAMMTGMLAARNVLLGRTVHDLWSVGQDAEYLEAGSARDVRKTLIEERLVPRRVS